MKTTLSFVLSLSIVNGFCQTTISNTDAANANYSNGQSFVYYCKNVTPAGSKDQGSIPVTFPGSSATAYSATTNSNQHIVGACNTSIAKSKLTDNCAANDFTKASNVSPSAKMYNDKGVAQSKLLNYKEAIDDFTKALTISPDYSEAYNNRGIAKGKLHDYSGAIADYTRAIEINPRNYDAYLNRGMAKFALQGTGKGVAYYTKVIELNPKDASAYYYRGIEKANLHDYKGATADYTKAIELNPAYTRIICNREAVADYNKAIELNPQYANAYYCRGVAKSKLDDPMGEAADYSKAMQISPNSAYLYCTAGMKDEVNCNYESAIDNFTKAIQNNPANAMAYYCRGMAKLSSGLADGGCLDLSKAGELGDARAYDTMKQLCR